MRAFTCHTGIEIKHDWTFLERCTMSSMTENRVVHCWKGDWEKMTICPVQDACIYVTHRN